jgi:PAS domain S-box-containing protein
MALAIFLGLLGTGGIACWVTAAGSTHALKKSIFQELNTSAGFISLTADQDQIDLLLNGSQPSTQEAITYSGQLASILSTAQGIDHAAFYRPVEGGWEVLFDPSGQGPRSIENPPAEMLNAYFRGEAETGRVSLPGSGGEFYAAFVPVVDSSGRIVGTASAGRTASSVDMQVGDVQLQALSVAAGLAVLALMAALAVGGFFRPRDTAMIRTAASVMRTFSTVGQWALMIGVAAMIVFGLQAHSKAAGNVRQAETLANDLVIYERADTAVKQLRNGVQPPRVQDLMSELRGTTEYWLDISLSLAYDAHVRGSDDALALIDRFEGQLRNVTKSAHLEGSRLAQEQVRLNSQQAWVGLLAGATSVFAFVMFYGALRRDRELEGALVVKTRAQNEYRFLIDTVPVGLFKVESGKVALRNPTWNSIFGYERAPTSDEFCLDPVVDEDRPKVEKLIETMTEGSRPFESDFRVRHPNGDVRHIHVQGIPAPDAEFDSSISLAFGVDITDSVYARETLERKNTEVAQANKDLEGALADLEHNLESVVKSLVKAVEAKDPYTAGHSERVMQYSLWIAEEMGLGPYEMRVLELGTLVHDVGKIGIPDKVLLKPGSLTDAEYDLIKTHPEQGVRILEGIDMFHDCLPIVRWHHEKLDGTGYPDGLKGDEISLPVRIASVADIFDAMTSTRTYRGKMAAEDVLSIMEDDSKAGKLDVDAYAALKRIIAERGVIHQSFETNQDIAA